MFCLKCGAQNADGFKFCMNCGAELPELAPQATPAPQAEPAPAPAPQPEPAPSYPMPWDVPAPDPVPYDDADLVSHEEPADPEPAAATPAEPPVANSSAAPAGAVPVGVTPDTGHEVAQEHRAVGGGPDANSAQQNLTPEFADIAAQLSAAFGQPLSVSVESAATTSDEDAAEELSYEEGPEEDAGFIDEPVDDSEDEDDD